MTDSTAKVIVSVAAAGACGYVAGVTHGQTGLGWLIFALMILW